MNLSVIALVDTLHMEAESLNLVAITRKLKKGSKV